MELDLVLLARVQFAISACFHIVFPSLTIGLAWFLVVLYRRHLEAPHGPWLSLYLFWQRIFALGFGVGVVSGIVMSFQFGLNWSGYAYAVGPVIGPLIGLEVATAFFLEAGFLGVMLFGRGRVSDRVYLLSVAMVATGALISSAWIMAANSWMHTPQGFRTVEGPDGPFFEATDWWAVVFNPAFFLRMPHMVLGAFASGAFLMAGVHAWQVLRGRDLAAAVPGLRFALTAAAVVMPIQLWLGDGLAEFMAEHQPAKIAALEGNWEREEPAPWKVLVLPDEDAETNRLELGVPYLGSILATHSLDGAIPGLTEFPEDERPNMAWVFYGFRAMYLIGSAMFVLAMLGLVARLRGGPERARGLMRACVVMAPTGPIAVVAGWITSEVGRQPWVVWGHLRTADAVSAVEPGAVLTAVVAFSALYAMLLATYVVFVLRMIRGGGTEGDGTAPDLSGELVPAGRPEPAR